MNCCSGEITANSSCTGTTTSARLSKTAAGNEVSPTCANAGRKMKLSNYYRQHVSSAKKAYDQSPSQAALEELRTVCNGFTGDTSGFGTPTTCQVSVHIESEAENGTRTWEQGPGNWVGDSHFN